MMLSVILLPMPVIPLSNFDQTFGLCKQLELASELESGQWKTVQ